MSLQYPRLGDLTTPIQVATYSVKSSLRSQLKGLEIDPILYKKLTEK
jgi:hypothetical protein